MNLFTPEPDFDIFHPQQTREVYEGQSYVPPVVDKDKKINMNNPDDPRRLKKIRAIQAAIKKKSENKLETKLQNEQSG